MKLEFSDIGIVACGYSLGATAALLVSVGSVITLGGMIFRIGSIFISACIGVFIVKYQGYRHRLRQGWREVDGMLMPPALADAYEKDQERNP